MKTKKILAALAAFTMTCSAVTSQPYASLVNNAAFTASAETAETDFEFDAEKGIITKYNGTDTEVVIPSEIGGVAVTSIGDYAFSGCSEITSITIPDSVTSIGNHAFENCTSLTEITIPESVTSIGDFAFDRCSNLTTVKISDGVLSIGYDAFRYCSSLTNITIPDSVTSIGRN